MDAPPKKRRWFQVHLTTALLLVFAAGGMLWFVVSSFRAMPIEHPSELLDFWYLPPLALFLLFFVALVSESLIRRRRQV